MSKRRAPISYVFTELQISSIELHISSIELEISPNTAYLEIYPIELHISSIELQMSSIELQISRNRRIWRYLQFNWRYVQFNCRYLQFNCRYVHFNWRSAIQWINVKTTRHILCHCWHIQMCDNFQSTSCEAIAHIKVGLVSQSEVIWNDPQKLAPSSAAKHIQDSETLKDFVLLNRMQCSVLFNMVSFPFRTSIQLQ